MTTKEDVQRAAELAARLARAYPRINVGGCARGAEAIMQAERKARRHAERCCSGEDGGYTRWNSGRVVHDPDKEARYGGFVRRDVLAALRLVESWSQGRAYVDDSTIPPCVVEGDPRGPVLRIKFPGEPELRAV